MDSKAYDNCGNLALSAVVSGLHDDELRNYLNECVLKVSDSVFDCYVAWESESPKMIAGIFEPGADYVPQQRGWYKQAVSAGEPILTDPYIDASTGKIVVTIACPLKNGGETMGVCGLDVDITELVDLTNSLKADENGYAVLVDASGNVVTHTKNADFNHRLDGSEEIVTAFTDIYPLYEKVLASADTGEIVQDIDYDGAKRFFPALSLGNTGWKIIYAGDYNEAFTEIVSHIIMLVVLGVGGMAIGALFLYFKFTSRLKPLAQIENIFCEMAQGKLDHEYPKVINDDIGVICNQLKETNAALKSYISDISRSLALMSEGDFTDRSHVDFVGEFTAMGESLENIRKAL
ncbi:MAG: cache domain-containing protein, partial [Ruminiclostridium sp.]